MAFQFGLLSFTILIWIINRQFTLKRFISFWSAALLATSIMFILVGISHLIHPERYIFMIDNFLPYPHELVLISGFSEILLGIGLLFRKTRNWSAFLLIGQLCMMFPANVNVAINDLSVPGNLSTPTWYNWSRLFFQPIYILWILKSSILNYQLPGLSTENISLINKKSIKSNEIEDIF